MNVTEFLQGMVLLDLLVDQVGSIPASNWSYHAPRVGIPAACALLASGPDVFPANGA